MIKLRYLLFILGSMPLFIVFISAVFIEDLIAGIVIMGIIVLSLIIIFVNLFGPKIINKYASKYEGLTARQWKEKYDDAERDNKDGIYLRMLEERGEQLMQTEDELKKVRSEYMAFQRDAMLVKNGTQE